MIRTRLTAATMEKGLRDFNAKLYIDTYIDALMFSMWLRLHLNDLRYRFHRSDEPDSSLAEWTFGIWARQEFLAELALKSQPVASCAISTTKPKAVSQPAGSPVRRKLL